MNNVAKWHELVSSKNADGLNDLIAEGATFYSPVVFKPQEGKEITVVYLTAAFHVLMNGTFKYVREINDDRCSCLEFELELDGKKVNGVDLITWGDDGLIADFKVMIRPLQGVNAVHQKMGEMLATMQK